MSSASGARPLVGDSAPGTPPLASWPGSKTRPYRKTGLLLNGLNECESERLPAVLAERLFVRGLYRESCPDHAPFDDVFPRLQVTKARRRATFTLAIIVTSKGSLGYVTRKTTKGNFAR